MRAFLWMACLAGCAGPVSQPPVPPPMAPPAPPDTPHALPQEPPWPLPDWPSGSPSAAGIDPARLDEASAIAERDGTRCLLVIRRGLLVYERYFGGATAVTRNPSWSLAKSYAATLVGIAIDRGELGSLDDPVARYVPEWKGTAREAITVRHLVSMTSGLAWSALQDYVALATLAPDKTRFALGLALADPPGSKWVYHNGAVQILEPLFRGATGLSIEDYAQLHLWSPLGMQASWAHDAAGHPTPYANVLATCRDHARLGYLYLRNGRFGGQTVLSPAWVGEALKPSQPYNRAYGLLFWLNGEAPALDAMMQPWAGRMVPSAPPDLFAARGFGGQFIDVIPSLDLVVVRFGEDPLQNLSDLPTEARFEKHDALLAPILAGVDP